MGRIRHIVLGVLICGSLFSAQSGSGFQQISGNLSQISVGFDGTVWGVNARGQIYSWNAQTSSWVQIPGSLKQVAVGSATAVWGVNADGQVYRWSGSEWFATWDLIPVPGLLTGHFAQIAVGADGDAWAIDSGRHAYHYDTRYRTWEPVTGETFASLSAGNDGAVWAVTTQGAVEQFDPTVLWFGTAQRPLTQVSVGADGDAWGLNGTEGLNPAKISAGFDSAAWMVDTSGNVWRYDTQTKSFAQAGKGMQSIAVASDAVVWALDASGRIYQYW
jgi:virginiamycin B lyase